MAGGSPSLSFTPPAIQKHLLETHAFQTAKRSKRDQDSQLGIESLVSYRHVWYGSVCLVASQPKSRYMVTMYTCRSDLVAKSGLDNFSQNLSWENTQCPFRFDQSRLINQAVANSIA